MVYKNIFLSAILLNFALILNAQQTTLSTGGDIKASQGSVAYSVGQIVYTTNSDPTGKVCQGIQQAYEIYSTDLQSINENVSFNIYPNPTKDILTILVNDIDKINFKYKINDINGKIIYDGHLTSNQTQVNFRDYPSSIYFIYIEQDNKCIQTFKIIKK